METQAPEVQSLPAPSPSSPSGTVPALGQRSTPDDQCAQLERRKSVRFSRFEKVYYTHSPVDYDRTSILSEPTTDHANVVSSPPVCQPLHPPYAL